MKAPTFIHMQATKRVLRYIKQAPEQGILLASTVATAKLTTYCHSDWASCLFPRRSFHPREG